MKKYVKVIPCLFWLIPTLLSGQNVIRHPDPEQRLQQRWDWAMAQARNVQNAQGYWVGYSIERLMGEQSFIGTFHSEPQDGEVILSEFLFGQKAGNMPGEKSEQEQIRSLAQRMLDDLDDKKRPQTKIPKQVAILFQMPNNGAGISDIDAIYYSNLSLRFNLQKMSVIWLGQAGDAESVAFLKEIYDAPNDEKIRKRAVSAIGLHDSDAPVMPMLRDFALKAEETNIRKEAVYRLSQRDNEQVLPILEQVAFHDRELSLQKNAVYRISTRDEDETFDLLKKVAASHPSQTLKKEAIYRISLRKNIPETAEFLLGIVLNSNELSLQKEALYRLSLFEEEKSAPLLIKIAETHPVTSIRKEAIYRLSLRRSSKLAVNAMENIAFEDEESGIRKEAVYRLAQVDPSLGIPSLARIAKSHPEKTIRKEAIYRLGREKHPDARKVLNELLSEQ